MAENQSLKKTLSVSDAVAVSVGVVVGAGIFKTPSLVAANANSEITTLLLWLLGGAASLVGALCYAELTSAYPHAGGDYHYLSRAYGAPVSFMFIWSRMTVIQTGSIAMWAFLIGDYASEIVPLGAYSVSIYAGLIIVLLTALNIAGIRFGVRVQKFLITAIIIGLICVAALASTLISPAVKPDGVRIPGNVSLGSAMIFVLLTYGGWNEAAYISSELKNPGKNMVRVLLYSIGIITAIYMLLNFVFIHSMGIEAVAESETVAADLMLLALGPVGAKFISFLISLAALSSMNGVIITSARTCYAMGHDYSLFAFLDKWKEDSGTPANALLFIGGISFALVLLGTGTRSGFVMMVDYTAPVFWFFFLLVGISLMILRKKEPNCVRPFRVPLYPFTPILFCSISAGMLYSSVTYTGRGALAGVLVMAVGLPILFIQKRSGD